MKNIILLISLPIFLNAQIPTLTLKWETEATLKSVESVIYDKEKELIYASVIDGKPWEKDGIGSIAKISIDGKQVDNTFITGCDAPKGLGIYNSKLYVADINILRIIDLNTQKIEQSIEVEGAEGLNDITIDNDGNVYISDSNNGKIYIFSNGKVTIWLDSTVLKKTNGLLALKNSLMLVDMETGKFYEINYDDKNPKEVAKNLFSGDGIVKIRKNEYLVSNWNGEVAHVKEGKLNKVLDTKEFKINAADFWYIESKKLLLIPTFFANKIMAYELK